MSDADPFLRSHITRKRIIRDVSEVGFKLYVRSAVKRPCEQYGVSTVRGFIIKMQCSSSIATVKVK